MTQFEFPNPMTLSQFLELFQEAAPYYKWDDLPLRGVRNEQYFCPLTAVFYHKTGKFMRVGEYFSAGGKMNISREETRKIANSADFRNKTNLHARMCEICGLLEKENDF